MADSQQTSSLDQEQPFIAHLLELRNRILHMLMAVLALVLCLFPFRNELFTFVAHPLVAALPDGMKPQTIHPMDPFMVPLKVILFCSVVLAVPYLLYQLWAFVAPGLYRHEKRLVVPLLASSTLLFYVGMAFAYYLVFPVMFAFFVGTAPEGVAVSTDISHYLDFVLTLFFAFGVAFEVPVATVLLVMMGVTTPEALVEKRPYIIVGAFVVGMVLTPPDVFSQTMLAVPMWMLFEVGVVAARLLQKDRAAQEAAEPPEPAMALAPIIHPTPRDPQETPVGSELDPHFHDPGRFVPMTSEEMDQELDAIEAEERQASLPAPAAATASTAELDPVDAKLRRVVELRNEERLSEARKLLYEVLAEGNEGQRRVARNILTVLDGP